MAQLTVQVNGKPYIVGCEDGEEAHLKALAAVIDAKVREAAGPGAGQLGETRLMLLGALMLADELSDAQGRLAAAQRQLVQLESDGVSAEGRAVAALDAAAHKLEAMATR